MKQKPNGLTKSNSKAGAVEKSEALFILSKREKIFLLYGAKTMNKGEYYARKQILELFDYDWQHDCDNGIRTWSGSCSAVVCIDCAIDS